MVPHDAIMKSGIQGRELEIECINETAGQGVESSSHNYDIERKVNRRKEMSTAKHKGDGDGAHMQRIESERRLRLCGSWEYSNMLR